MGQKLNKGIGIEQAGGAEKLKRIKFPIPQLKEREILIKVIAVSANPVDYKKRATGLFHNGGLNKKNPMVLGYDAVGIVVKTGSQAQFYNITDKVYYAGDVLKPGSNSEYQIVDERIVGRLPKNMDEKLAAGFPLVTLTAWEGLEYQMNIKSRQENKSILVIGGAGGVGSMVIQIAKIVYGLKVTATASRDESIHHCKKLGADYTINHYKDLSEQIKEQNIGLFDYIYCTTDLNDEYLKKISEVIKPFGYLCTITGSDSSALNIDVLKAKSVKIVHELMFTRSLFSVNMEKQKEILDKLSELIEQNKIQSIVGKSYPFDLDNLKIAHFLCEQSKNIGKVVLYDVHKFFEQKTGCL